MSERMSGMRRAAALTGIAVAGGGILPATGLGNGTEGRFSCPQPTEAGVNPSIEGSIDITKMLANNYGIVRGYRIIAGPDGAVKNGQLIGAGESIIDTTGSLPLLTRTFLGETGTRGTVSVKFEHPVTSVVADDAELIVGKTTTAPVIEGVTKPRYRITADLRCELIPKEEKPVVQPPAPAPTPEEIPPTAPVTPVVPVIPTQPVTPNKPVQRQRPQPPVCPPVAVNLDLPTRSGLGRLNVGEYSLRNPNGKPLRITLKGLFDEGLFRSERYIDNQDGSVTRVGDQTRRMFGEKGKTITLKPGGKFEGKFRYEASAPNETVGARITAFYTVAKNGLAKSCVRTDADTTFDPPMPTLPIVRQ